MATRALGAPDAVAADVTPAPTGIDGQLSVALGTAAGAKAALQCSILADTAATGLDVAESVRAREDV